mgnify:CR=1 FL=1
MSTDQAGRRRAIGEGVGGRGGTGRGTDHALRQNKKGSTVALPDGVTCIGSNAFSDCQKLAQVNVGNGVGRIEQRAFEG